MKVKIIIKRKQTEEAMKELVACIFCGRDIEKGSEKCPHCQKEQKVPTDTATSLAADAVSDAPTEPAGDGADAGDAGDGADAGDAGDGVDAGDAGDGADAGDAGDAGDGADAGDAGDGADAGDAGDGADAGDAGDAGGLDDPFFTDGEGGKQAEAEVLDGEVDAALMQRNAELVAEDDKLQTRQAKLDEKEAKLDEKVAEVKKGMLDIPAWVPLVIAAALGILLVVGSNLG